MEKIIIICVSLFITFNVSPILLIISAYFIESFKIGGIFDAISILIISVTSIILFFIAIMKLGEKIIIRNQKIIS